MRKSGVSMVGGGLLLIAVASYAERPALSFIKTVSLPDLGVRIKLFPDARETPAPPPTVHTYEFTQGERRWKEERYDPLELWRQGHFAGQWLGRFGNRLVLATMTRTLPAIGGGSPPHVTREAFDLAMREAEAVGGGAEAEMVVSRWVADFAGCRDWRVNRLAPVTSKIEPVIRFRGNEPGSKRVAYAFRVNWQQGGQTNGGRWVCALFELNPLIDLDAACRSIERDFLGSISLLSCSAARTGNTDQALARANRGEELSPDVAAVRRQVIEGIRNMNGWWYDVSPHYILLSNQKGSQKVWVDQLHKAMGTIRGAYARCVPEPESAAVSVIRLPATAEEYLQYVGKEHEWTGGMWVPGRKELMIRPMQAERSQDTRRNLMRVAFHEGFHQYAFYAFNQGNPSLWFNEGYAELFGNAVIANGRVRIEEAPRNLRLMIQELDGGRCDLHALFMMSAERFYHPDRTVREAHYAMAWALMYYLKKGVEPDPASPFAGLLDRYVAAMRENGGNGDEATRRMLAGIDEHRLQADFERFWRSPSRQAAARRSDPFGTLTAR